MKIIIKNLRYVILLIAVAAVIAAAFAREYTEWEKNGFAMDTVISISAKGIGAESAVEKAYAEVLRVESAMSAEDYSGGLPPGRISGEAAWLIEKSLEFSQVSGGLYDITVKPLVDLWNITGSDPDIPPPQDINAALAKVGYDKLTVENNTINMPVDLGSIAKGYAADKAAEILRKNKIKTGIVNLGGDIYALGSKRVGVRDPFSQSDYDYMAVITVRDCAVVTSGTYKRNFTKNGVLYHHIINPKTGYPENNGTVSVTVVAESAADADALATVIFLLGRDGADFAAAKGIKSVIVDENKNVTVTGSLDVDIKDDSFHIDYI